MAIDQYLVYGNPIQQSKSPYIHTAFAKQTGEVLEYDRQFVELDGFAQAVKTFIAQGGKGANVTAPFKEEAMAMCDVLSDYAKFSGSVNTLTFKDGKIYGDTTDGPGLVNDLLNQHVVLAGAKILLLGAGGAAKGVVSPLLKQQPIHLTIANRTVSKAQAIVDQYPDHAISACSFDDCSGQEFDVIINATSAGLAGNAVPISDDVITTNTVCYDMTYGKQLTPFLQKATDRKAKQIIDGLGMLVGQAAESFYIWRGVRPDTEAVLADLRAQMLS